MSRRSKTFGRSRRRSENRCHFESLETRVMLAADALPAVQNSTLPADVDGDGQILPLDALLVANALNCGSSADFMDVNGDGQVTAADAQSVRLNLDAMDQQRGEGEAREVEIEVAKGTFVTYDANDGSLRIESSNLVTTLEIVSASGIFTGEPGRNLRGTFDQDEDNRIFKLEPVGFTDVSFGPVAEAGLSPEFIRGDLTINGSITYVDPANPGELQRADLSNKAVRMRLQVADLFDRPTGTLNAGEEFQLRMLVEDRRGYGLSPNELSGVFAAYMDVTWDSRLAEPLGGVEFTSEYMQVTNGDIRPGLIDEIGAVATSTVGLNQEEFELASIHFRATQGGQLVFRGNPADISPQHDVLLFGETQPTPIQDIEFVNSPIVDVSDATEAPDLVQFAKDLAASRAVFYGASWCAQCTEQKEMFEDGQRFLPFVEVTDANRRLNQVGIENKISAFPTWVFADGSRLTGIGSLQELSARAGVPIPVSNVPSLAPIESITLRAGSPLHIPLDGYDPNGGRLTYSVESDSRFVLATLPEEGSRSMRIDVADYGEMVFQLHEKRTPRVTEQITELAETGFYDGISFHRVVDSFVIQGGDPTGTGTSGSDLPDFDDQYHVDLQHNRTGVLSMAKITDDTNNSQFFVAEGPQRHLDFNHSIFGQLVEGEANRDAISNVAERFSRPRFDVIMESVSVFEDTENSLLMLKAREGAAGPVDITVTVRDLEGHESQQQFVVNVVPDIVNGGPFLQDIPDMSTPINTPIEFNLVGVDVENDEMIFSGVDGSNLSLDVDPVNGRVIATPAPGFIGVATATVGVTSGRPSNTADALDSQLIMIEVTPAPPAGPRVIASTLADGVDAFTRDLTIEIQFDQPIRHRGLSAQAASLTATRTGQLQRASGFSYDLTSRTFLIRYEDLPFDRYSFTLNSDSTAFVGQDGRLLDGENINNRLPSGDGFAGGDYVVEFSTGTSDLDQDGTHDIGDVESLCALIQVGVENPPFDFDRNGQLDSRDMSIFLDRVFSTGPGDSNLDGVFDSSDLVAVFRAGEYEDNQEGNSQWAEGDWNCDGEFDSSDLVMSFARGGYVRAAEPDSRALAAALLSLYSDEDASRRLESA